MTTCALQASRGFKGNTPSTQQTSHKIFDCPCTGFPQTCTERLVFSGKGWRRRTLQMTNELGDTTRVIPSPVFEATSEAGIATLMQASLGQACLSAGPSMSRE
jgi:hypothetical protein